MTFFFFLVVVFVDTTGNGEASCGPTEDWEGMMWGRGWEGAWKLTSLVTFLSLCLFVCLGEIRRPLNALRLRSKTILPNIYSEATLGGLTLKHLANRCLFHQNF